MDCNANNETDCNGISGLALTFDVNSIKCEREREREREMLKAETDCNATTGLAITLFITNKVKNKKFENMVITS